MIMIAVDDCASEKMFVARWERNIHLHLRTMEYNTVELFLDGMEDYLKGPEYLASVSGEELMKKNGAKNEKLVPVETLDQEMISSMKHSKRAFGGNLISVNSYVCGAHCPMTVICCLMLYCAISQKQFSIAVYQFCLLAR